MKIHIICVGKLKESYWRDAIAEYEKRLGRYGKIEIRQVADEKTPETLSRTEEEMVKQKEGERLLKQIPSDAYVVALALEGKALSSEELADFMAEKMSGGISSFAFIIGGSLGLDTKLLKRADYLLSASKLTFPHQMMRVILLEQLYRAFKIMNHEPYHK